MIFSVSQLLEGDTRNRFPAISKINLKSWKQLFKVENFVKEEEHKEYKLSASDVAEVIEEHHENSFDSIKDLLGNCSGGVSWRQERSQRNHKIQNNWVSNMHSTKFSNGGFLEKPNKNENSLVTKFQDLNENKILRKKKKPN